MSLLSTRNIAIAGAVVAIVLLIGLKFSDKFRAMFGLAPMPTTPAV